MMAGKTTHAATNSLTMIHPPMVMAYGNAKELAKTIDVLNKIEDSLIDCISTKSGKTYKEVKDAWFDGSDHWLSATEAQAEGFVDDLTTANNKVNPKIKNLKLDEIIARFDEFAPPAVKEQKKVHNWFVNLFSNGDDGRDAINRVSTDINNDIQINDMDINLLRNAFKMDDAATEDEIVAKIETLTSDLAARGQQITDKETELAAVQEQLAQVTADFETFKTKAGATSAVANVETDALDLTGHGADNFLDAFAACKEALGK
jgi:hypothetical protein